MCLQQHLSLSPGPIAVNSLVYNHNGQLLLTGAADGRLRLYGLFISVVLLLYTIIYDDCNFITRMLFYDIY